MAKKINYRKLDKQNRRKAMESAYKERIRQRKEGTWKGHGIVDITINELYQEPDNISKKRKPSYAWPQVI